MLSYQEKAGYICQGKKGTDLFFHNSWDSILNFCIDDKKAFEVNSLHWQNILNSNAVQFIT
ncbi:MAG TPA: hypothetical protein DD641_03950 [Deltaproteobacteria bacterium]|nr:hypothetical protein [Deltaproteobacteria bacterium]